MKLRTISCSALSMLLLTSCVHADRNTYGAGEVGHDAVVMYGIVKSVRNVAVVRESTGTGATIGAVGGGLAGSAIGKGNGSIAAIIGGAVIGGIAGAVAEGALQDSQGIEYTVKFSQTGETRSIVQNIAKTETPIAAGQCVMVQMSGTYQRVMPNNDPSDCPAPVKNKVARVKTKITRNHEAETTMYEDISGNTSRHSSKDDDRDDRDQ